MEALVPPLMLTVVALLLACVALYYHLRRAESAAEGRHSLFLDELHAASAAVETLPRRGPAVSVRKEGWQEQAVRLARAGLPPAEIARLLSIPAGEVEVVVGLAASR